MTGIDRGRTSPYAESLLARGRMLFQVTENDGHLTVNTTLPEAMAREVLNGAGDNEETALKRIWLEAFSGRIPLGWEESSVALKDIGGGPRGERLGRDLVLAGITHPETSVRLVTAAKQTLTKKDLAVAMAFSEGLSLSMILRQQRERGVTVSQIDEATRLFEKVAADDAVALEDLMRGEF